MEKKFKRQTAEKNTPRMALIAGISNIVGVVVDLAINFIKWLLGILVWIVNTILTIIFLIMRFVAGILNTIRVYVPRFIGNFIPTSVSIRLDQLLVYAGISMTSEDVIGVSLVYGVLMSIVVFLIANLLSVSSVIMFIATVVSFITILIFPTLLLNILVYKRTDSVENVLSDILDMIAQNIIAGMTTYNALWSAARPEFGPLAMELQEAAKSTLAGTPLADALIGVTNRIKSEKLERTIRLIIQGMKSGAELPSVLQSIAADVRAEQNLQKAIKAETNAQAMFIIFSLVIGAPLLFGVSLRFITTFDTLYSKLGLTSAIEQQLAFTVVSLRPMTITPGFFMQYAVIILFFLCFFGSVLIGLIRSGKSVAGLEVMPILTVTSITVFLLINYLLGLLFGSMFVV